MELKRFFQLGLMSVVLAILAFYQLTTKNFDGTVVIKRPSNRSGSIEIYHDQNSILRIYAKSLTDAYYGLGRVHAQHRLWSMHLRRMLFSGNLSQMFGPALLNVDQFIRTIGFRRTAQNDLRNLDQRALEELTAYSDGINDYVSNLIILPSEFLFHTSKIFKMGAN